MTDVSLSYKISPLIVFSLLCSCSQRSVFYGDSRAGCSTLGGSHESGVEQNHPLDLPATLFMQLRLRLAFWAASVHCCPIPLFFFCSPVSPSPTQQACSWSVHLPVCINSGDGSDQISDQVQFSFQITKLHFC